VIGADRRVAKDIVYNVMFMRMLNPLAPGTGVPQIGVLLVRPGAC